MNFSLGPGTYHTLPKLPRPGNIAGPSLSPPPRIPPSPLLPRPPSPGRAGCGADAACGGVKLQPGQVPAGRKGSVRRTRESWALLPKDAVGALRTDGLSVQAARLHPPPPQVHLGTFQAGRLSCPLPPFLCPTAWYGHWLRTREGRGHSFPRFLDAHRGRELSCV